MSGAFTPMGAPVRVQGTEYLPCRDRRGRVWLCRYVIDRFRDGPGGSNSHPRLLVPYFGPVSAGTSCVDPLRNRTNDPFIRAGLACLSAKTAKKRVAA